MRSRRLTLTALSWLLLGCTILGASACSGPSDQSTPEAATSADWISEDLRSELASTTSTEVAIAHVSKVKQSEDEGCSVIVTARTADLTTTSTVIWEVTSRGGIGPWRMVPVGDDGTIVAGLDYPAEELGGTAAQYDMAYIGGRIVFLDFDSGRWTDVEGGEFQPIADW